MSENNWIENLPNTAIICAVVGYTAHQFRGGMVESSRELGRSHVEAAEKISSGIKAGMVESARELGKSMVESSRELGESMVELS